MLSILSRFIKHKEYLFYLIYIFLRNLFTDQQLKFKFVHQKETGYFKNDYSCSKKISIL